MKPTSELNIDELEFEEYKLHERQRADRIRALLQADMDRGVEEMRAILAREMYRSSGPELFQAVWLQPMPWWTRWFETAKYYLLTVWEALRGRRLYDDDI